MYYCGAPTCADDILLLSSNPFELQSQLDVVLSFSQQQRYIINPTKTTISVCPGSRSKLPNLSSWSLGNDSIEATDVFTHLGIDRYTQGNSDQLIQCRIQLARRTCYSLMGSGFHGTNGVSPTTALKLYTTYVLPRMLHCLEALVLNTTQTNSLNCSTATA